ncbi:MAG: CRISPR-associated endonuclease Cas2 [Chloroflexota bacterium]
MAEKYNFYVLAYDIADDKRRVKIAKAMEAIGERVQGSVFEAYLSTEDLEKMIKRVKKIMKEEEDSLRIYFLCQDCRQKIATRGKGQVTPPPGLMIV